MPAATGEMNEWWRNSSRLCTFEMWHSTTGRLAPSMASCNATEVWVNAPGLKTAPTHRPALTSAPNSWIQSMSAPSWLDCRNSTSNPSSPPSFRHIASTSARVMCPYTSGLRVPRRFRLGPLSTRTEVMDASCPPSDARRAQAFVLLARDGLGVLLPEVVQVDPERLPRAVGGDRRDDRQPERDAADRPHDVHLDRVGQLAAVHPARQDDVRGELLVHHAGARRRARE